MRDYIVERSGQSWQVQLTEAEAKRLGARPVEPVEAKQAAPANKQRRAVNK